jgi:flagellar motor switch protein FliG
MTVLHSDSRCPKISGKRKSMADLNNFDDLKNLADRNIQLVLREVEAEDLAAALKGAGRETVTAVKRNMSERAARMLKKKWR